jgi:RNA polymerase sigma-70 factor (ECF subfamily)
MKLHVVRHTYDPTRPFEPWMYAIARTVLIDYFRATGRRTAAILISDEVFDEAAEDGGAYGRLAFQEALANLSEEQREALKLMKIEGLSVEEAALRAGISASNMKVRMHRALKAMKAELFD